MMTLVYCAGMPLSLLSVTMQGTKLALWLKLNPEVGGVSGLLVTPGDGNSAPMPCGTCGTLVPTWQA